ncbi:hypothetical protein [Metapseudomonas otitidis]|uniref:hypothetical protein n=1 Tax=Metapseudomonas otitidis TaxID=319939 RepID=UPI00366D1A5C
MRQKHLLAFCVFLAQALFINASQANNTNPQRSKSPEETELRSYSKKGITDYKAFRLTLSKGEKESDTTYTLILKNGDEKPNITIEKGRNTGNKDKKETIALTDSQIKNLQLFELGSNFWKLPTEHGKIGFDGAEWILEGIDGPTYHKTIRWSPLPPYYSFTMDPETDEFIKSPNTPPGSDYKYSDEVGLDMLCLFIFMLNPKSDELPH